MLATCLSKFPAVSSVAGRSFGLFSETKRSLYRFAASGATIPKLQSLAERKTGEDAFFATSNAVGVADGVGGWASEGIDPSRMSRKLMFECSAAALKAGPDAQALDIVNKAYNSFPHKRMGSTTACVACLDTKGDVNVLNVGDSGFTLLSLGGNGEFSAIGRSVPKDHGPQYRFAPLQLGDYSEDKPANGDVYAINAKPGDVFVLASDGVYDNLSEDAIVSVANEDAQLKLLAGIAKRGLAEDGSDNKEAWQTGLVPHKHLLCHWNGVLYYSALKIVSAAFLTSITPPSKSKSPGKPDDITVVLGLVVDVSSE